MKLKDNYTCKEIDELTNDQAKELLKQLESENRRFHAPPVCTAYWDAKAWCKHILLYKPLF